MDVLSVTTVLTKCVVMHVLRNIDVFTDLLVPSNKVTKNCACICRMAGVLTICFTLMSQSLLFSRLSTEISPNTRKHYFCLASYLLVTLLSFV